ncbi:putative molybdenum cofactor biosynthesis protein D2 (MoaD2) / thiamineS [Rhizocola hellebori]|uniref:Putative molybdenum cofactor biosynthesis protein D2 (MoaD2) / thiamineS n=2 Tax=Rhizocola hellebori TaxID=1392758 RepID=A0A8J3QHX9_9ACTN|nr:putative molybdenum cofactor biosynthesis protein D2 (MoaD2) / thiamineS [Rhizocola hellebori]
MITVRYFAGARAAAGVAEETFPSGTTIEQLASKKGEPFARVLHSASFLVDGLAWHDRQAPLPAGVTVDVLPPFAGG